MPLTPAQLTTLKADIAANTNTVSYGGQSIAINTLPNNSDANFAIAGWYNQTASPAWVVWKTDVTTVDIRNALVWSEYDTLSVSKQNAFTFLCSNHVVNAGLPNVRQGIQSIFSAPAQSGNLAALVAIAKRDATRAEKLLSTGTGTTGAPATMGFEGQLSYQDIDQARTS